MNKLIPQQEYYVSDNSISDASNSKRKERFVGYTKKGRLVFEMYEDGADTIMWKFAVPIPKPEYIPWDAKTRPLGGVYKRKSDGVIFEPSAYTECSIRVGVEWYDFNQILKEFDYIPDLSDESSVVPCGVLKDE